MFSTSIVNLYDFDFGEWMDYIDSLLNYNQKQLSTLSFLTFIGKEKENRAWVGSILSKRIKLDVGVVFLFCFVLLFSAPRLPGPFYQHLLKQLRIPEFYSECQGRKCSHIVDQYHIPKVYIPILPVYTQWQVHVHFMRPSYALGRKMFPQKD